MSIAVFLTSILALPDRQKINTNDVCFRLTEARSVQWRLLGIQLGTMRRRHNVELQLLLTTSLRGNKKYVRLQMNNMNSGNHDRATDDSDFSADEFLCDVNLTVEEKPLYTSRSLLAFASPVFKCMFSGEFKEKGQSNIDLPDKSYQDVSEMIRFIHPGFSDDLEAGTDSAFRLLPIAEEYQIDKLKEKCEDVLLSKLKSGSYTQDFVVDSLIVADKYVLQNLLQECIELCSKSKTLWQVVKDSKTMSLEIKTKAFESRLRKLEFEQDSFNIMKQRVSAVAYRLKEIVHPHENHCRCRTELKLRSPLQRTCVYCARTWCSENVSTDSYRNSYWFYCNHRIGYTVANDTIIKSFLETKEFLNL
ncbi:BTB and MATH domain-containing protein 36-like [Mytilus edulis]|uniref:BTB and MATH domain-containing protein 36-like n=1 Tax=Mytilus edulis TaxID=6550 RepID=UPI0039EE08D5